MRQQPQGALEVTRQLASAGLMPRVEMALRALADPNRAEVRNIVAWPEVVDREGDYLRMWLVVQYQRLLLDPRTSRPVGSWEAAEAIFAASLEEPFGPPGWPPLELHEFLVLEIQARRLYGIS